MKCDNCKSGRIIKINGNVNDLCDSWYKDHHILHGCPYGIGIGGGDYMYMEYCLNCGKIQGEFPVNDPQFD